jgi:site-specific DNA recombinase
MIAAMAQWERENTAERVQFGVEQKILQGEHVGVFPFGYTNKGELIKEEADLIKEVRSFFLSGYGYKKIAMALNRAGKLRRSKLWSDSTVAYTVENPIYYGMVRISSRTKEGVYINWRKDDRVNCVYGDSIYPAIFTKEQHEETKREIERRYKRNGYSRKNIYWFSGTLKCGRCGASMFGRKVSAQQSYPETLYYICSNRHHKKTCDLPIIRQIHMEKLILDYLKSFAIDSELLLDESAELVKQKKAAEQRIAQLKQQIGAIRERRKKWQYMFANELISSDELRERLQEENDLLQQHEEDIKSLSIQEDDSHDIDIAKNFLSIWPKLIDEEKKELVSNMFSKIVVDTDLTNPRVSKGTFYPAYITELLFN